MSTTHEDRAPIDEWETPEGTAATHLLAAGDRWSRLVGARLVIQHTQGDGWVRIADGEPVRLTDGAFVSVDPNTPHEIGAENRGLEVLELRVRSCCGGCG